MKRMGQPAAPAGPVALRWTSHSVRYLPSFILLRGFELPRGLGARRGCATRSAAPIAPTSIRTLWILPVNSLSPFLLVLGHRHGVVGADVRGLVAENTIGCVFSIRPSATFCR